MGSMLWMVLMQIKKKYLKKEMFWIVHPEEKPTEKHINSHTEHLNGAASILF